MKRIIKLLSEKRGSVLMWFPFLMLFLLIFGTVMWEYSRLNIVALGVRDAVQAAATQVCTDNYSKVYDGVREGYSGGYKLNNADWVDNIDTSNIMSKIDAKLGSHDGEKAANGKTEFQISNLSVEIKNASLAPTGTEDAKQFTAIATYTLTVPLSFGWQKLPPLIVQQKAIGAYSPKGSLSGDGSGADHGKDATGISLSESNLTLEKGSIDTLAASISPEDSTDSLRWAATNPGVCSVDQTGTIMAKSVGQSTIVATAKDGNAIAQCDVTVVNPVTGVTLNKSNLSLVKGETETLAATITPADATNKEGLWASSNGAVCTVDQSGNVFAVNAGTAVVSATTKDGSYVAQCTVTVTIPPTGISLNKTTLNLVPGAFETLKASVYPVETTKAGVLWAASDEDICTVDQSGTVTAIKAGTCIVTATTEDGQFTASCTITVSIPVTAVSLNKTAITLIKGTNETLSATVWPLNATNKTVVWSSSSSSIAAVDQTGKVTGVGVGSASIRVTTNDGGFYAEAIVTVKPDTYVVTANAVHGTVTGAGIYHVGSTVTLTAIPDPHYHFVNWTNSNGTVIGTSTTYTISNLNSDTTVTANFEIDMFTVTVNATSGGTATGGGYYAYGTEVILKAVPNDGYHFVSWSDGVPGTERKITVTDNATFTAMFRPNAYTWTSTHTYEGSSHTYADVTNSSTYSSDAYYTCNIRSSCDCTSYSTYTFTTPTVFKAGTVLSMVVGTHNAPIVEILINGVSCALSRYGDGGYSGYDTDILHYVIPSDITISTITVKGKAAPSSDAHRHICAALFVTPAGEKSFMLNSTNTSENQDCSNSYYYDSPGKVNDKHTFTSLYNESIYFRESTSRFIFFHFVKPKAISYITATSYGCEHATTMTLNMRDVNGQSAQFRSSLTAKVPSTTIYPSSYQQLNSDNLTDFELNCQCGRDSVDLYFTVYFKDGTSVVIGSKTTAGSFCG